ncbi:hypothetical protein HY490_05720, partial [Candidatus Woesearchaeota archaeon]|nr:hypothetical protein [Candidatus Woesearchaeota archaeon]
VTELATGFIYLGSEAKEHGLIDNLGSRADAVAAHEKKLNITAELVTYKERRTLFDVLGEVSAKNFYAIGEGFGNTITTPEPLLRV